MSEVTVGQAAKVAGVPVEALRELCDARKVPARKGERGHWYLNAEDIPSRDWVLEAVREQYREDVAGAQEAMARFMREVEAVQLDLNEAAEDTTGRGRLGNDLRSFSDRDSPFDRAQFSLMRRLLDVQLTHRRLQATLNTPAADGGQQP
ncbi:MAG: hypothetical protein JWQ26_3170 [Modestobacter sp.]|jgi:hypothetical protein|nr:hypothetical protein [Modestobacter sp.]